MSVAFVPAAPKVGSLVSVRGRDWVVLPAPEEHVVRLRPLTGTEEDAIGVYLPLERLSPSQFPAPIPENAGDVAGGILLLDTARLALRDGAAPFRSLGRLSVTPRPYQFVPLIMALRQNRVRLLIADDVGVGKTIEAGMIARELLDRGLAKRLGVICPAHLCDQWEAELREKFGIEAAGIQPSRYARLERDLPRQDVSVFRHHRHLVASIDFIKNKNGPLREAFIQNAPDLIIVDEAHACARPRSDSGKVEQQRYEFLNDLMLADPNRQLLLVTATPHSGIEESFRSLLGLLDPAFDPGFGVQGAPLDRDALIPYVIQRRRTDLQRWHGSDTPFPERLPPVERTFALNRDYHALFDAVLAYCRDAVAIVPGAPAHHQRVRYWAAISLLRCVISSPRAAAAVLGGRSRRKGIDLAIDEGRTGEAADALYRPQVIDSADEESALDLVPAAPIEDAEAFLASLAVAIQRGIQVVYQVEEDEIAVELIGEDDGRRLVLWEAAEGGTGVWERMFNDIGAFATIAKEALAICHFDPIRNNDIDWSKRCVQACYECLLSYRNQRMHRLLNRHAVRPFLDAMSSGTLRRRTAERSYEEQFQWLLGKIDPASTFERDVLLAIHNRGLALPDKTQVQLGATAPGVFTQPDFYYERGRQPGVCLYVDGPSHDEPNQRAKDAEVRDNLRNLGYGVVSIHHGRSIDQQLDEQPNVFGGAAS